MRADRLMSILILLQSRGKMTAKELANELEVSVRTILRDMDALTTAGIPIVAERGRNGGWRLFDHFRSKLSGFTIDDMKSLFLVPSSELLEDLGFINQRLDTRQKLLAVIPSTYRGEAQAIWECIHIDTGTWRQSKEKVHAFKIVQQAVLDQRKLRIDYEQANGVQKERFIEPFGLVAKGNKWYLVAARNGEMRNYRVSRIRHAKVEHETFQKPPHFNLAAYWKQSKAAFVQKLPNYDVQVEIHPDIMKRINFTGKFVKIIKADNPNGDKWIPATLRFDDQQEAIAFILGFANKIKVLSPKDLPEKVVSLAKSVIDFYNYG